MNGTFQIEEDRQETTAVEYEKGPSVTSWDEQKEEDPDETEQVEKEKR